MYAQMKFLIGKMDIALQPWAKFAKIVALMMWGSKSFAASPVGKLLIENDFTPYEIEQQSTMQEINVELLMLEITESMKKSTIHDVQSHKDLFMQWLKLIPS